MCFNNAGEAEEVVAQEVKEIEEPVVELPDTAAEVDAPAIDVDTAIVQ
jgi:hypothetical protein